MLSASIRGGAATEYGQVSGIDSLLLTSPSLYAHSVGDVVIGVSSGALADLSTLVDAGDRDGIRSWASCRSIEAINTAVASLDAGRHDHLPDALLDSNASDEERKRLLTGMHTVLDQRDLGFYAEIWSYTYIELGGEGFFGGCNRLWLGPSAFDSLSDDDVRGVLMHESFHSFDCVNGGPVGSLDEGAAIWVVKSAFPQGLDPGET